MEKRTQLTVMLENRPGSLSEVVGILAKAEVNLEAISINDGVHHGVLKLVPAAVDVARKALKKAGLSFSEQKVYALSLADRPGSLAGACALLAEQGINIDFVYGSTCDCAGHGCDCGKHTCGCSAMLILSLADGKAAAALLKSGKKGKKGKKEGK